MSDAQDGKAAKAKMNRARQMLADAPEIWDPLDLQFIHDAGATVPVGARFAAPSTAQELANLGFAGGGAGPDGMIGLQQWLNQNGKTLQDAIAMGGLPLKWNGDGTVTYDPAAQTTSWSYNNPDDGLFHKVAPLLMAGIAAGPAITTALGGAPASVAAGGAMDMGVGLGGSLGSWGGITPLAEGAVAAGAGGAGGLMQSLAQAATGTGGLTQAELAALIESGTTGAAGAALETAGGLGTASLGDIAATGLANATGLGGSVVNGATSLLQGAGGAAGTGAAASAAGSGLSNALQSLGINASPSTLDLIGKALGIGLGAYASNQQADASKDLFNQYMGMGAPYRAELANLNANPSSFLQSDLVKGALQQGSDALARSLSAKVGNPATNPTALQEMQNYTSRGLLDAYNNRWNQLSSAGQLGTSQAANLGTIANQSNANTYNALGAGLQSVFGNQRDYAGEYLDLMRGRSNSLGNLYPLP